MGQPNLTVNMSHNKKKQENVSKDQSIGKSESYDSIKQYKIKSKTDRVERDGEEKEAHVKC
jgi:hypothetical protein